MALDSNPLPEVWLRGALPDVPALVQPVAHALLQAQEEVHALIEDFPEELLWERPDGLASVGFHLQHLAGVVDRLFTYARGGALTKVQLDYLASEGAPVMNLGIADLLAAFDQQVDKAIEQLRRTAEKSLTEYRAVGRAQLPSTQLGLLFHAAEHTQRHTGQLLVTIRFAQHRGL
jgi:uncharacterized damage-inducible protein DinB